MTIEEQMIALAYQFNVDTTENLPKVARARERMGLDIDVCPCSANDLDRGCISTKCLKEIKEDGICHCGCFRKKGE